MTGSDPVFSPGVEAANPQKKLYHLRTLYEVTRELTGMTSIPSILESFLPLCMGPVGASSGFVLIRHDDQVRVDLSSRGLAQGEVEALQHMTRELADKIFSSGAGLRTERSAPVVFRGRHLAREPLLPAGTEILVAFVLEQGIQGIIGLGPRIDQAPYEQEDLDLVLGLKRSLRTVLQNALAHEKIQAMNTRLERQNLRLSAALEEMEGARNDLDRRALQLQALYDASVELSGLVEPQPILKTFLLLVLGSFSVPEGFIVVYDQGLGETEATSRGLSPEDAEKLTTAGVRDVLFGLFVALKDRIPHIMESRWTTDQELLADVPGDVSAVVLFTVDEECRGALGLGQRLQGGGFSKEEHRLMSMLLSQFMVSLDNARHFVMAKRLNDDLERRNLELEQTLADLTSARDEIDLLETTKERILSLVHREKERVSHASWIDFAVLGVVSVVLGLLFNMASPSRLSLVPASMTGPAPETISQQRALSMHQEEQALFVDARPTEFFEQAHIQGASNIPLPLFDFVYDMKLSQLDPSRMIIVYGRTYSSHYDTEVVQKLLMLGHEQVFLLQEGLQEWPETMVEEGR